MTNQRGTISNHNNEVKTERNLEIVKRRDDGESLNELGRAFKLSPTRIVEIYQRTKRRQSDQ